MRSAMYSTLLILLLLTSVASLGSWLFNQWFSEHRRASALALGTAGMGLVLLLGATAVAIVSLSASWSSSLPWADRAESKRGTKAASVAVADLGSAEQWPATTCIKPLHATSSVPRR